MAGARGSYQDNQVLHGGDLDADLTAILGNDAAILAALLANWNWLIAGGALTPGSGYGFTVAAATVAAQGVLGSLPQTPLTVAGNSSGVTRTDLVVATLTQNESAGNNPSTGNPQVSDQWVVSVVAGAPGKATLASNQVQLGSVAVPNGATGIGQCTLTSFDTSPNSQGPLKTFLDVLGHLAATITSSSAVHGVKQGSGNGFDADTVDGTHASGFDAAGAATAVQGSLNTEIANRTAADSALQVNINNEAASRQSGDTGVQTNLNMHTAANAQAATVHNLFLQRGVLTGIVLNSGMGRVVNTYNFPVPFDATPAVVIAGSSIDTADGTTEDIRVRAQPISATQFQVMMSTAANFNGSILWIAVR